MLGLPQPPRFSCQASLAALWGTPSQGSPLQCPRIPPTSQLCNRLKHPLQHGLPPPSSLRESPSPSLPVPAQPATWPYPSPKIAQSQYRAGLGPAWLTCHVDRTTIALPQSYMCDTLQSPWPSWPPPQPPPPLTPLPPWHLPPKLTLLKKGVGAGGAGAQLGDPGAGRG